MPDLSVQFRALRALDKSENPLDTERREAIRAIIAEDCQRLVQVLAERMITRCGLSYDNDFDDLVSEGNIALLGAMDAYDPEHESRGSFGNFAAYKIAGALVNYAKRVRFSDRSHRAPGEQQLFIDAVGLPGESHVLDTRDTRTAVAMEAVELRDALKCAFQAVAASLQTARQRAAWERGRRALEARFLHGLELTEIAAEFGISKPAVCNLMARAKALIAPHLEASLS